MAGSNILELRMVRRWADSDKQVKTDERIQFRNKDVVIAVLGISLGSWSPWQDLEAVEVVDEVSPP